MFALIGRHTAPLLSIVFIAIGTAFYLTFVSMRLTHEGFSEWAIGWVQSAYYAGMLTGAIVSERIIARIGFVRALAAAACFLAASILFQDLYIDFFVWSFLRFCNGFCVAGLYVIIESWLLISGKPQDRGTLIAIYMVALYAAQSAGQFCLRGIEIESSRAFVIGGFFSCIAVLPVVLSIKEAPSLPLHKSMSIWNIFKNVPLGFVGCVISGIALSSLYSFLPIYAENYNFEVDYIVSLTIFGGMLFQWPLGHLSDIVDRRKALLISCAMAILPAIILQLFTPTLPFTIFFLIILGGGAFTIYPISSTYVCDRYNPGEITQVIGALGCIYGVGSIIGPPLASLPMEKISVDALFGFVALVVLILSLLGFYSLKKTQPVEREQLKSFEPLTGTNPIESTWASTEETKT